MEEGAHASLHVDHADAAQLPVAGPGMGGDAPVDVDPAKQAEFYQKLKEFYGSINQPFPEVSWRGTECYFSTSRCMAMAID